MWVDFFVDYDVVFEYILGCLCLLMFEIGIIFDGLLIIIVNSVMMIV